MAGDHFCFVLAAQFPYGDGLKLLTAGLFDDLGPRTFIDHGIINHFDIRNVDGFVDDGRVIDHDSRWADGL